MAPRNRSDLIALAGVLLLVGACRHYGWVWWPVEMRGLASKMLGGAQSLALLAVVHLLTRSWVLVPVLLWWAWEEMQVVLCTALYMVDPWPVPAGAPMCSAREGFDLGALGLLVVALLAHQLLSDPVKVDSSNREPG